MIDSNVKNAVKRAFQNNSIDNTHLENAVSEALISILSDHSVIRKITEIQDFEKKRRDRFRG